MSLMDDANLCVRQLVRYAMGMPPGSVRPSDQAFPVGPQGAAFATVRIMSDGQDGVPGIDVVSDGVGGWLEEAQVAERITASVQFFKAPGTPATLRGASVPNTIATYTGVTAGGFDITIDGVNRQIFGLDFSAAPDMPSVAAIIQTALRVALANTSCFWNGTRFVTSSPTVGLTSQVGPAVAPTHSGPPVDVSTLLGLTAALGALPSDNASGQAKYSNLAFDQARRLPLLLELSRNTILMQQIGLGYEDATPARNLSAISDKIWESRGSVDLTFAIISREQVAVAALAETTFSYPYGLQVEEPDGVIQTRTL